MACNKIIRIAEQPARPIMSFNTFIQAGGGFLTGRSIGAGRDKSGPYECDVPVHNTLGISLKGIIVPLQNAHTHR